MISSWRPVKIESPMTFINAGSFAMTVVMFVSLQVSCAERAALQISLRSSHPGPILEFRYCDGRVGDPCVFLLEIVRIQGDGSRKQVCTVYSKETDSTLGATWTYGERRISFTVEGCSLLEPGEYVASARGNGPGRAFGLSRFTVNRDSTVLEGKSCA
jgi:hypothetical protein